MSHLHSACQPPHLYVRHVDMFCFLHVVLGHGWKWGSSLWHWSLPFFQYLFPYISVLYVCKSAHRKKASTMNCYVVAWNWTRDFWKSSCALNHWAIYQALTLVTFICLSFLKDFSSVFLLVVLVFQCVFFLSRVCKQDLCLFCTIIWALCLELKLAWNTYSINSQWIVFCPKLVLIEMIFLFTFMLLLHTKLRVKAG